ncbi:hypothetical protein GUITHDRAFT_105873 [Guillardia theta CCMP2712]|uniref:Uncharacterized protein n=1 Tax=Guillardia theta (strain CCMP2712) TaxID=905079 RepID=L1JJG3_GUITC|nr:hypothetical protein GUITHDRAFT_105873 [Guillardia theta CCMP2712]EKX48269.1 hypothetical protein GUITHDRAFT_105873 [Guillardia theta CCMP2712]|eukprot:XP_005835249.1 hypothetical protein GUITHDRAFT_105873 [Guillardia theta CCMP2712]
MDKNNVVAQNAVFVESLQKERKAFRLREEFMLVPKSMNTIAPKPCHVRGGEMPAEIAKKLNSTLEEQHKTPKQKYDEPMTTQQEIGWLTQEYAHQFKDRKQYGLKSNPITKYAEKYVVDMGRNPFQRKPPIA